jgi:peptidoglycan/LPS O-acetylase OafA/YrhL
MHADTSGVSYGQPAYRPDLDGLRAIAVLSVIAFHAFPTVLTGGFIGVDIFFVISGFLISSLIAKGLESGSFRFVDFYSRRIRRIFPALLILLLVCFIAGWQILLANEYAELGQHVAAGAGFVSNLVLWAQSGYFDTVSDSKPLLHLWSLGIEEQFYIFWPLMMWMAYRFKIRFAAMAGLVLFISFAWNIGLVSGDSVSAFYMPYCRVWELLIGTLLALAVLNGKVKRLYAVGNYKDSAAILGLLLLCGGVYALNKGRLFPGWWALLPTVGAALLLSTEGSWINNNILSHKVLVGVGLISYPLYLWHWPLLSFGRIVMNGELPASARLGLILLAVLLAFLTYWYCERHLRHQGRKVTTALFVGVCFAGFLGWNIHSRDGLDFRYRDIISQPPEMVRDFTKWEDKAMYPIGVCDPDFVYPNSRICLQSSANKRPDTVVFGDSHAFHAYWGIAKSMGNSGHTVKLVGRGGCTFGLYQNVDDCDQTFQRQAQWIATDSTVKNVFIVHRLVIQNDTTAADAMNYQHRMDAFLGKLIGHGKHVVYFYAVPEGRMNPQLCGSRLPFGRKTDLTGCNFPLLRELEIQRSDRKLVAGLLKKYPTVEAFDPSATLCKNGWCQTISNGRSSWMDDNHISESASYVQGEAVAQAIHLR